MHLYYTVRPLTVLTTEPLLHSCIIFDIVTSKSELIYAMLVGPL